MAYNKPIPEPDPLSQPFWDGAKRGKLMLPRCTDLQPRALVPAATSARTATRATSSGSKAAVKAASTPSPFSTARSAAGPRRRRS